MVDIALFLGLCINNSTCDFNQVSNESYGVNYNLFYNTEVLEGSEIIKAASLALLAKELAGKTLRVTTLEVGRDFHISEI